MRDEAKYERLVAFGRALPADSSGGRQGFGRHRASRTKSLAADRRDYRLTGIRVGNEEYAQRERIVRPHDAAYAAREREWIARPPPFPGKDRRRAAIALDDARLARISSAAATFRERSFQLRRRRRSGQRRELRRRQRVHPRNRRRRFFGEGLSHPGSAPLSASPRLTEAADDSFRRETKSRRLERVAERLGNTPAVCRKAYVHPAVMETVSRSLRRLPSRNGKPAGGAKAACAARAARVTFRRAVGAPPQEFSRRQELTERRYRGDVGDGADRRIEPRHRHSEGVAIDLRGGMIKGCAGSAARRDIELSGSATPWIVEVAVHLEGIRTARGDLRADEGPLWKFLDVEEVGRFQASCRGPVRRWKARRIEHGRRLPLEHRAVGERHRSAEDRHGPVTCSTQMCATLNCRVRFGGIDRR